jgi:maltooligosyltrehalose trehalohydrolase
MQEIALGVCASRDRRVEGVARADDRGGAAGSIRQASMEKVTASAVARRCPVGAEIVGDGDVSFRVWAPAAQRVSVVLPSQSDREYALTQERGGYFSAVVPARAGDRYGFRLDDSSQRYPDPASRFQPEGPHEASEVIDARAFQWSDANWPGVPLEGQVIYEMHAGTFTPEGTWASAQRQLDELTRLGITVLELMPVAEFEGRFGWGYDGVDLFAPSHLYGRPDDLRRFIDAAHARGLGVLLDVVYNHFGPSGNYLRAFSPAYFTDKYENEWGDAINFDGPDSGPVREFFIANAAYWIEEFHFDGLRLDATQQIFDASQPHIIAAIGEAARQRAGRRRVLLVGENESQDVINVKAPSEGGRGLDALWNDDFHHSAMVAATGYAEAYYSDTYGTPQEFISAAKYGYLYQGQYYHWQRHRRGTPTFGLAPATFVVYLQNHDQVANSARGLRGHQLTSPAKWRALTALMLLMPNTPMLFQGQEFAASSPFLFFADFEPDLADAVRRGRQEFLTQFPSVRDFVRRSMLDDPGSQETFARCTLDFKERHTNHAWYALHADLLRLRRDEPAFRAQRRGQVDGAVIGEQAFVLRFFVDTSADERLLLINLGQELNRPSLAEPLVAPPVGFEWLMHWSSNDPKYGGSGTRDLWPDGSWSIPPECAIVVRPEAMRPSTTGPVRRRTA